MGSPNLVNGKKEELIRTFRDLQKMHGNKWPSILRKFNSWHDTTRGNNAWKNATRGKAGNELLRLLISDMQQILTSTRVKKVIKKQGLTRRVKS